MIPFSSTQGFHQENVMKNHVLAIALSAAALGGCVSYESKTSLTNPTATGVASLIGNWASASATVIPAPSTCVDFKWNATEQTGSSAKGSFSATCAGDLKVQGTASGTLSGTTIAWSANGTAVSPTVPTCAITLTGTAELTATSIRVPYNGNTCLGPVSGVEVLNKK